MKWGSNTWVGGGLVGLAIGMAIFAPWIALTDPVMDANLMNAELPPSWEFPFGTDAQGRDIYSRICYGARVSLRDIPVVQGCILVIVLFFLVINMLVDVLAAIIDPRIRYS